ncbi:MAG: hypothetical protein AAF193_12540, partial [Bacteroidota bacterium]
MVLVLSGTTQHWNSLDGGFDCFYTALVYDIFVDEEMNELYCAGSMPHDSDCTLTRSPAKWNGENWDFLDITYEEHSLVFYSICKYNEEIYACNLINGHSGLFRYDDGDWTAITDTSRTFLFWELKVMNGKLYA